MSGRCTSVVWLVRATDDRVVTASNPNVAASILGIGLRGLGLGKFVYPTLPVSFGDIISQPIGPFYMVLMTGDVNIVCT